ncbi:Transcription factor tau subunit sfc4 [Pseudocercospora fuligena]|uniref:Transcription factor tau subunit sfc4 n=1 Tax=Pseudocercospora fuligena TaxID=685502 RepID=A0A8H6VKT2_9PEZI|nr:Transcription factor tau subunit sfc4 [Pseudocercospora fuligena]
MDVTAMDGSSTEQRPTDGNDGGPTQSITAGSNVSEPARPVGPACALCARLKIACDRGRPCSVCKKKQFECFYWNEVTKRPVFTSNEASGSNQEDDNRLLQAPAGTIGHGQFPDPTQTIYSPHPIMANGPSGIAVSAPYSQFQGTQAPQPAMALPSTSQLTEAQRAARDFHMSHGDPGANTTSLSALAGYYADQNDGGPGRDGARLAWRHAITYSGLHSYDDDFEPDDIDGTDRLLEEAGPTRGRGSGSRGGRGRRGWRQLLKGTEHEDVGKTPSSRGVPNIRRGRGVRGGRRSKPIDPGREFKMFMQEATKSYFDLDYEAAIDACRQAIGVNPEIFGAHSLLSTILNAQGRREDSIKALEFGAVTVRSAEIWEMLAGRILEAPPQQRTYGLVHKAIECYAEAIKMTRPETAQFELRARKYELYKELNESKGCRMDLRNILKIWPHKTYYMREYAQQCAAWHDRSELKGAFDKYEAAFEQYKNEETFGDADDPTDPWEHLNTYLELADMVANPWTSIYKAKQIARWLLNRQQESFWDRFSGDDREFDITNERRAYVPEWQMGKASRDSTEYGEGLPIEIRVRLGMFRLKMGLTHHEEALRHFRPLLELEENIGDFWEVFVQVAQALRGAGFLKEAAEFYDPLRSWPDAVSKIYGLDEKTWMAMATCYHAIRRNDDAILCYEVVQGRQEENYDRASASLAKLYEEKGELDKARYICDEFINRGRHDLLIDAGVQMVPEHVRNMPARIPLPPHIPSGKITPAIKPRIERAPPRPLMPVGADPSQAPLLMPAPSNGTLRNSVAEKAKTAGNKQLGPTSREVELLAEPKSRVRAGRERKKRKRDEMNILEAICGPVADSELVDEIDQQTSSVKRPRLTKKPKAPSKAEAKAQARQEQLLDSQARVHAFYATVKLLWQQAKDGKDDSIVEQWIDAALGMLGDFAAQKVFFPYRDKGVNVRVSDREETRLVADTKASGSATEYLGLSFPEWHRVFVDLALFYARNAEQDKCYRILQDVLFAANVFCLNRRLKWTQNAAAIHCGQVFNDSQYLIELSRDIIKDGQCRSGESYQLFAALNRFSFGSNWFSAGPTQKFMLRQVKALDFMAMTPEMREGFDWSAQAPTLEKRSAEPTDDGAELNAGVLLTYGHMVAVANHSFSALPYYYRALAIQPENICVNLSIAAMWIQNSMKRQVSNRQFGITQGLSFLYRYYDLRVASGKVCHLQEAEYNTARMWHYLGLTHLAMPAYENVLGLSEQVQAEARRNMSAGDGEVDGRFTLQEDGTVAEGQDIEDFAQEAAFALQGLYALVGNEEAARAVTEDWLVI